MLVFDISLSKDNVALPPVSDWFLDNNITGREDFRYKFDELQELKRRLNRVKQQLDPIYNDPNENKRYTRYASEFYRYEFLRGERGLLAQKFGAEIVTNAWLKMYELANRFFPDILRAARGTRRIKDRKNPEDREKDKIVEVMSLKNFNTFHLAEAPGAFILAINHYMKTKTDMLKHEWNWLAESYKDIYVQHRKELGRHYPNQRASRMLGDHYGIMQKYKYQWIYGADGDGDITSDANIRSFRHTIKQKYDKLHLITSDVKYIPRIENFDEEERNNLAVHVGHTLCSIHCLARGGSVILKTFTYFESSSVSLLYLLSCCFEKFYLVKPSTSKAANSETYLVGIGFRRNLTKLQISRLFHYLNYIARAARESRYESHNMPALFKKGDIPPPLLNIVARFSTILAERQTKNIGRNLRLYQQYRNRTLGEIKKEMYLELEKHSRMWLENNVIFPLNKINRVL